MEQAPEQRKEGLPLLSVAEGAHASKRHPDGRARNVSDSGSVSKAIASRVVPCDARPGPRPNAKIGVQNWTRNTAHSECFRVRGRDPDAACQQARDMPPHPTVTKAESTGSLVIIYLPLGVLVHSKPSRTRRRPPLFAF